jgi:hypothetical protein
MTRVKITCEQLLTIEEKRYGGQQVKTDHGKTAKLSPEALDKGFAA